VYLPTTRSGYNLVDKMANLIPITFPPLAVRFANALTTEEAENLKSRGASVSPGKKPEDTLYSWAGDSVSTELLSILYRHKKKANAMCASPFGAVNLSGFQQIFKALAIATWFCKTQSYPAFSGPVPDDAEEIGGAYDTIEGFVEAKRKGTFSERITKRQRMEVDGDHDEEEEDEDAMIEDVAGLEDYELGSATSRIPRAKPSTPPDHIYGTTAQIPTLPGLSFPYFPGMLDQDGNYVTSVIREYFLECLGDTRDAILAGHKAIKGGLGQVSSTECGKILQHMFLGIKLAIEAQARVFFIIEQRKYCGFSLHGWYFTVSIDSYVHRPLAYPELIAKARLMDEHAVAVAQILAKLMKMKIGDRAPTKKMLQDAKENVMKNPRALSELVRKFDLEDNDDLEELEKLANKLSYTQSFLSFTVENVLFAIDLLVAKSFPPLDRPMFTRGGVVTSRDPLLSVFAMFGDVSFSLRTAGGQAWKIAVDRSSDTRFKPYTGKQGKEVKPNPTVILSKKSLGLCVDDWKLFMSERTALIKSTRDQAFRAVTFGGKAAKDFWYGVIDRIGPMEATSTVDIPADEMALGDETVGGVRDNFLDFL
jgi:hypothetical protein